MRFYGGHMWEGAHSLRKPWRFLGYALLPPAWAGLFIAPAALVAGLLAALGTTPLTMGATCVVLAGLIFLISQEISLKARHRRKIDLEAIIILAGLLLALLAVWAVFEKKTPPLPSAPPAIERNADSQHLANSRCCHETSSHHTSNCLLSTRSAEPRFRCAPARQIRNFR